MKASTAVKKLENLAKRLACTDAWLDAKELLEIADLLRHRAKEEEDPRKLEDRQGFEYNK